MSRANTRLLRAALSALHFARADTVLRPFTAGSGVIFMLHHVRPTDPQPFEPNRILSITPEFLETVIRQVLDAGFDVVPLDAVPGRLERGADRAPFAAFTFDDGYRDNIRYALPVFRKYGLPFAVYVPSRFPDGEADLWWLTLEEVVRRADAIVVPSGREELRLACATLAGKERAYHKVYWTLRGMAEPEARRIVAELARAHGVDGEGIAQRLVMSWEELRALADDPLVTIGGHTELHFALGQRSEDEARGDIARSMARIETELQRPCRHFSYPYGDAASASAREFRLAREVGAVTAVTTRKGLIHARHGEQLTALPRLSLNGDYQDERYLKVLLSGLPFALRDAVKSLVGPREAA